MLSTDPSGRSPQLKEAAVFAAGASLADGPFVAGEIAGILALVGAAVYVGGQALIENVLKPLLTEKGENLRPNGTNPKDDKMLTPGEIRALEGAGVDVHGLKGGRGTGSLDLFKDTKGDIHVKPKKQGDRREAPEGEYTGLNIRDFLCKLQ